MKRCHCCMVSEKHRGTGLCLQCYSYISLHTKTLCGLEDLNQDDLKLMIKILGAVNGLKKKLAKEGVVQCRND